MVKFRKMFSKKPLLTIAVIAGIIIVSFSIILKINGSKDIILLYAVGDIMLDKTISKGVEYKIRTEGGGDYKFPFLKIAEDFKKADIIFGNLECVISDKGEKIKKGSKGGGWFFRAKPEAIKGLKFAGFNILSVANNHTFDYGKEAMEDNLKRLGAVNIKYAGAGFNNKEAWSPKILEVKGTKVGFLAYVYKSSKGSKPWQPTGTSSGIAWINRKNLEKIKKDIIDAKKETDILVVSIHWGQEFSAEPTPMQFSLGEDIIDAGADLVLGHHPHIIQPVEKYKKGWIAYSLGNFVFDQTWLKETMRGLLLEVIIKDKKIKKINPKEIRISDSFQPYLISK